MADIAQVIATGGIALVSAAVGAGLTYWLGALNRRHQETREDRTRWYEKRLQAYTDLTAATFQGLALSRHSMEKANYEEHVAHLAELATAVSSIRLVGSPEVFERAEQVVHVLTQLLTERDERLLQPVVEAANAFEVAARIDLGHPEPLSLLRSGSKTKDPGS
jgi:hypothetical protein